MCNNNETLLVGFERSSVSWFQGFVIPTHCTCKEIKFTLLLVQDIKKTTR